MTQKIKRDFFKQPQNIFQKYIAFSNANSPYKTYKLYLKKIPTGIN